MRTSVVMLFLMLFFLSFRITAQPYIDLINVKYYALPEQTDFAKAKEKSRATWLTVTMEAPIKIKEDYLILSPFYETYKFENSSLLSPQFYGIALSVNYLKQWKNKLWQTAFVAIPRISSDLKNISRDDYQLGGAVVAIYKKKSTLDYKFGLYYNSEYFGPFILPLLGIDWNINDDLILFGLLPASMNLEYKVDKHFYTGISILTITNSYRLFNGNWYKVADNHLNLFVDYYLTKNFVFNIEAGHTVLGKYTYGVDMADDKTRADLGYKNGFIFKAGIAWRIRLDELKKKE